MSPYLIIVQASGLHLYKRRGGGDFYSEYYPHFNMVTPDDTTNIQTILDLYPRFFKHPARYHSHSVPFASCKC